MTDVAMDHERVAASKERIESTENTADMVDLARNLQVRHPEVRSLPIDGPGHRETWRRVLAAYVQPLPVAVD